MTNSIRQYLFIGLALVSCQAAHAQFGVRFADPSFTAKGYNAVYSFESGQLLMLTDDNKARNEGYIFVDSKTGAKLSSFFLDNSHGGLLTPDGSELLITGSDGSIRTMGRYDPTTLSLINKVQIKLGDAPAGTTGIGGQFEPTPDGKFIFSGTDLPATVDFIAKYDREFAQEWATSFQYKGTFSPIGVEAYPLPGGDVGIYVFFNQVNAGTGRIEPIDVFGLLDGVTGDLKWTFTYQPPVGGFGNRIENFRFTFGSDGSFFAHAAVTIDISNINAPVDTSKAKVLRIHPDGTLAYSKTLAVDGAVVVGEHYLDGDALLHFSFDGERKTQFVILDSSGDVTASTAVEAGLSAGDGDLTATRRSGTDFAFIRAAFSGGQETLARLNLTNGELEFQGLPNPLPGNPVYEAVGTSGAYPVAPFNTPRGLASVSRVIAYETLNQLGSNFRMGFVELPSDGSLPTCIAYTPSTLRTTTPLPTVLSDTGIIDLMSGWTTSSHGGLGGLAAGDSVPDLTPMNVTVEVVCEDDGGDEEITAPRILVSRLNSSQLELRFETVAGLSYEIVRSNALGGAGLSTLQTVSGTGSPFTFTVTSDSTAVFYQVIARK